MKSVDDYEAEIHGVAGGWPHYFYKEDKAQGAAWKEQKLTDLEKADLSEPGIFVKISSPHFRIGTVIFSPLNIFLLDKLKSFHMTYPGIRLKLYNHSTPEARNFPFGLSLIHIYA